MLRSSIIYRRFSYVKKRNTVNLHIISKLISVIIIFLLILTYVQKLIIPQLIELSSNKAYDIYIASINAVINETDICDNLYNSILASSVDKNNNIKILQLDSLKAKKFSNELSNLINKKLKAIKFNEINLPFGFLTGVKALSRLCPIIHVKYSPFSRVETIIISNFQNGLKNEQSFKFSIRFKSSIYIDHPLAKKSLLLDIEIPLSETIFLK